MDKRFLAILAAIGLIFVGVLLFGGGDKDGGSKTTSKVNATNHVIGKLDSKVVVVEYGDFQCSACAQYYPISKQVQATYSDRVKFQFRNFPLTSIHPNAFAGSRAAEAAAKQGKFWEMHDILFENNDPSGQTGWVASQNPMSFFETFAKQLKLDLPKFKADYISSEINDTIKADLSAGEKLDISGTPSFFVNGKKLDAIPETAEGFGAILEAELKKVQ